MSEVVLLKKKKKTEKYPILADGSGSGRRATM
jgi:hypothetical protein